MRKAMWRHIKTIILVTFVTALVWVYAESETLRTQRTGMVLALRGAEGSQQQVELVQGGAKEFSAEVELQGPSSRIEQAQRVLREGLVVSPGLAGFSPVQGEQTLDLKTILRAHPKLNGLGVSVERVEPATASVRMEEFVRRSVPVRVRSDADFLVAPTPSPASIEIIAPKAVAELLGQSSVAIVSLAPAELERLTPGRPEVLQDLRVQLPVEIAQASRVRMEPSEVDVGVTVRNRTAEVTLPRVPVYVRLAPHDSERWVVTVPDSDQYLTDVRVSGPAAIVQQVQAQPTLVYAEVLLTTNDLEQGISTKEAVFPDLPGGLLRVDALQRNVRVRVERR